MNLNITHNFLVTTAINLRKNQTKKTITVFSRPTIPLIQPFTLFNAVLNISILFFVLSLVFTLNALYSGQIYLTRIFS